MKEREDPSDIMSLNFDHFAKSYKEILNASIWMSGEDDAYFDLNKINCIKRWIRRAEGASMILDFGCGIGKLTRLMAQAYPQANVCGYDVSAESIKLARKKWGNLKNLVFKSRLEQAGIYDLISVANVFHHIKRDERRKTLIQLGTLLRPDGMIAVFEHNPFNPLTLYTVKNCPFDAEAELIYLHQFKKLAFQCGLRVQRKKYTIFFPGFLKFFRRIEPHLGFLPIGAQYMIILSKFD